MTILIFVRISMIAVYFFLGTLIAWILIGASQGKIPDTPQQNAYLAGAIIAVLIGLDDWRLARQENRKRTQQ